MAIYAQHVFLVLCYEEDRCRKTIFQSSEFEQQRLWHTNICSKKNYRMSDEKLSYPPPSSFTRPSVCVH